MELKKSKVFTKKLIALFLSALLVISTFTGVMAVFAKSTEDYHDDNLAANFLTWAETTDNQTAEAILDYADLYLPQLMEGLDLGDVKPKGTTRINFVYNVPVIGDIAIKGYVDSIDGVIDLVKYVNTNILHKNVLGRELTAWAGGDIKNIKLDSLNSLQSSTTEGVVSRCGVAYRSQNDAKDIIIAVAKLLYVHSNNYGDNKNVFNQFVTGSLDLGLIGNFLNLWDTLKEPLGMWDNYQTNLVYNIVANLIWENTDWYSEADVQRFKDAFVSQGKNQKVWNFDDQLFGMLTSKLLQQINVQVTYSNKVKEIELDPNNANYGQFTKDKDGNYIYIKDNSKRRWFYIYNYIQNGQTYEQAVASVNANEGAAEGFWCDPDLRYSLNPDGTSDGNILLFTYGDETLEVEKTDTLTDIAFNALELAWTTVLDSTLGLLEVDYERKEDSSVFAQQYSNFDREFYSWKSSNGGWTKATVDNKNAWKANYTEEIINAWAADVYDNYNYKDGVTPSAANFIKGVKENYEFDRSIVENPQNNWRDIDATKLFVELRYSPLADLGFDMQTGPINLYFAETGATNIKEFFNNAFTEYDSIAQGFNNGIVAAAKDFLLESSNVGLKDGDGVASLDRPEFATIKTTNSQDIANTLVTNAAHIFEYVANATDENILGAYYANHPAADKTTSANITEASFEEAGVPMMISLINQISLTDTIHNDDWDTCVDAEGAAVVALREYLSYSLPDKDYSPLYKVNDNNELVADYDVNKDGKKELFADAIMPMARDALGYVIQSVVTCRKQDGSEWSVYESSPTTDQTTIFEILNSVLCYYAGTDDFDNSKGSGTDTIKGKGAAALLGCVDKNGKCTVKFSNTLWQNIDIIANTVFPVVGSLQNGTYGGADSYDLIYTKFIEGILEIGKQDGAGNCSITALIKQLVDIINSAPLNTGADVALYDYIVAPTVNAVFGPKYTNQTLNVVPTSAAYFDSDSSSNTDAASPFNALIHVDTLGGFNDMGILSTLISNLCEAFGVDDYKSVSGDRWQGAMFAVKAVNNFIPSFVPQLSDHTFGPVTAKVDVPTYSGLSTSQSIGSGNYLRITNTAIGLNRFYRESPTGKVKREPRYFAEIKNAKITNANGYTNVYLSGDSAGVLSPGETLKIPVLGSTMRNPGIFVYKAEVTYNMFEAELVNGEKPSANGNYLFDEDITTFTYITLAVGGSWQGALYPDNRADKDGDNNITKYKYVAASTNNNNAGATHGSGDAQVVNSTAGGEDNNLIASVPKNMVIPSADPSIADKYSIRVYNSNGSNSRKYSGVVAFAEEGTQYYPVNGTTVSNTLATVSNNTSSNLAYAYIDEDANLIKRDYYDYRIDDGAWVRGFSRSELDTMEKEGGSIYSEFNAGRVTERTHVTYTFEEALAAGIVTGVQKSGDTITNVFVNPTSTLVSDSASGITFITPFDGFYFNNHGSEVSKQNSNYDFLIAYDGDGVTPARDATRMNLAFIPESGNKMIVSTNVIVADQSDQYTLTDTFQNQVTKMASYRPADFLDFDGTESANYNAIVESMTKASELAATALSVDAATGISSVKITQARTAETMNHGGDIAFVPATADEIPSNITTYKKADIFYLNKECTMPIYGNTRIKDSDVVDLVAGDPATGKDSAGQDIVKYGGVWYLANEYKYESEWDTETYWLPDPDDEEAPKIGAPYYAPIKDADHIAMSGGNPVYLQKQFVYRNAKGEKVNSNENWVVKFAEGETVVKPNENGVENRGTYQQGIDTINYYNSIFSKILKPVGAQSIADEVTAVRSVDSDNVNYDVATYEKMVLVAREAEKLIWYEDAVDPDTGEYIYEEDGSRKQVPATDRASMEIEIAVDRFKVYYARAQATARGYIGNKLEAEISDHHAIGGTYANFTATKTGETVRYAYSTKDADEEDDVDVYTIKVAEGTNLGFGERDAEGNLINDDGEGNKKYTDASWDAYVNALGEAVDKATNKEAKVSEVYAAKAHLVTAENNLDTNTGEDTSKFTVTGKITIAEDSEGTSGTYGIGGIDIMLGDTVVGTSGEDGSFEIQLPKGEASTTLTIKGETTVDREITITGEADVANVNIPVVVCDYLDDEVVNYKDVAIFVDYVDIPEEYTAFADLLTDGAVNYKDVALFVDFVDVPVEYEAWNQADYVLD